jgi:polyphosphate kinase
MSRPSLIRSNPATPKRRRPAPSPPPEREAQQTPWLGVDPKDLKNPSLYINRELGWLEFNRRVLAQASNLCHPLLERVKFLAITGANLDEFFMIRVATTLKKQRAGIDDVPPDGYDTARQLEAMREGAYGMLSEQASVWRDLRQQLESEQILLLEPEAWTPGMTEYLSAYFAREIFPSLTPLAFDPGHPFPFISNLSTNLAVVVRHGGRTRVARVKVPAVLPRFIELPASVSPVAPNAAGRAHAFVFIEDVIRANVQALFPGTPVKGAYLFRIVRDADLDIDEDEADDLLETVDRRLKEMRRGAIALVHVASDMPERILQILVENLEATDDVVLRTRDRLGLADWRQLVAVSRPDLKYPHFSPPSVWRPDEDSEAVFDLVRDQDVLLHHPFEAFDAVESFLRAAVKDPRVVAIKMTLYRIGQDSPLIPLLIEASEAGKQVAVLVELKARFDERNNIIWARQLESHGIHVVYGFANLKTHAKLCLVVRQEIDGVRRYLHTSTGNYNPATARLYTDVGLITADPDIVADASSVFNALTGYSNQTEYRSLVVAPTGLRPKLEALIAREADHARAGRPARLVMKLNALTDDRMIRALYRASQAGVPIDLIVRGICSLRPGIPGVSETIRVRSIVGRFLEHSRIYWFENGGDGEMYIGSADLMERNLDRRVETLCPIRDPRALAHLRDVVLDAYLRDTERATVLEPSGAYVKATGSPRFDAQAFLLHFYAEHAGES